MGRLPSLKTILLILICLGVLLILGFISQCQQLQGGGVLAGQLRHHPQQAALHSPYVVRSSYQFNTLICIKVFASIDIKTLQLCVNTYISVCDVFIGQR